MKLRASPFCTAAMMLFFVQSATAAPIVSLSPAASPTTVGIGQTISVAVELAGLEAGQQLDSLAATIVYDGGLLAIPTVNAGPIVPSPLDDPLDLLISTGTGLADVAFLTFGIDAADHITSNGTFFTFEATALTPGSANIALDFVGATLFNATNPSDPTVLPLDSGVAISFEVVPEPTSLASTCVLVFALALRRCGRTKTHAETLKRRVSPLSAPGASA